MMRKLLIGLALWSCCLAPAWAATLAVLANSEGFDDPIVITITAPTSGADVILAFQIPAAGTISTVTEAGGAFTQVLDFDCSVESGNDMRFFRRENVTGGPTSITVDMDSARFVSWVVWEAVNAGAVGQTGGNCPSGSVQSRTTSVTTANANEAGMFMLQILDTKDVTPQAGWSRNPTSGTVGQFGIFDSDLDAAGAKTVGGDWTGQGNAPAGIAGITVLNDGGGGGGGGNAARAMHHRRQQAQN
jgi:hypothetical protein